MTRDELRERWRISEVAAVQARDKAERARQGREILFDQMVDNLLSQAGEEGRKLSTAAAERMVRTSDGYRRYLRQMHDLKLKADLLKVEAQNSDRLYWEMVSSEATYRAEARLHQ